RARGRGQPRGVRASCSVPRLLPRAGRDAAPRILPAPEETPVGERGDPAPPTILARETQLGNSHARAWRSPLRRPTLFALRTPREKATERRERQGDPGRQRAVLWASSLFARPSHHA